MCRGERPPIEGGKKAFSLFRQLGKLVRRRALLKWGSLVDQHQNSGGVRGGRSAAGTESGDSRPSRKEEKEGLFREGERQGRTKRPRSSDQGRVSPQRGRETKDYY